MRNKDILYNFLVGSLFVFLSLGVTAVIMDSCSKHSDYPIPEAGETWMLKDSSIVLVISTSWGSSVKVKTKENIIELPEKVFIQKIK